MSAIALPLWFGNETLVSSGFATLAPSSRTLLLAMGHFAALETECGTNGECT